MSKIDELLKNEKVEWKKLGDSYTCLSITTGLNPRKNFKLNDSSKEPLTSWYITTKDYSLNEKIEFVEGKTARITEEARQIINKRSKLEINDILFSAVGTVGKIAFVDFKPDNFDVNESTFILKPNKENIIPKYLVYYLKSDNIQGEVKKLLKGSTLAGLRKNNLEKLEIPIPSIETQEKIVEILDNFTNYVTELQAELQARTKQYEYYRDMILSEEYLNPNGLNVISKSDKNYQSYKLNKVADIERGKRVVRNELNDNGKYAVYQNSLKPLGYYDYKNFKGNKTFVISAGAAGEIFYTEEDFWAADDVFVITTHGEVLNKYIYYFLQSKQEYIKSRVRKASIPRLSREVIETLDILFPNKAVQKQIVEILDGFQNLIVETKGLLPKEIELRQKQYEYYREKLLDFKK